ncbi:cadmium/zinc-transporting ATPase HMA3 [Coffea arabica]|uniref:Cadmium/zinc-transporting ATPase HMA3 n=1 Tax=Coffea arabica TaxID=13443 RepID=A0A6P6SN19_COFAR
MMKKNMVAHASASHGEDGEEKKIQKSYFDVLGICCPSEVPLIENILKSMDGVKDVSVIVPTKTVIVLHDSILTSQLQIVKALNKARLEASIRVQGVNSAQKKWPSPYAIASGVLLLLSFLKYFYYPFHWLALGSVAFGIIPIIFRALSALRNLTLGDINILLVITVAGSIVLRDYWEAATIVFLFTISEWLESLASHKATAAMSSLLNLVPQRAVLAETGEEVDVNDVKVNSVLAVKGGEIIPIDGVVVEGNCDVDEKTLTGESFPAIKQKDSNVWAGTINVNGYISIRTTELAEDCVVARMTKLVEEAQNNKSRTQRFIEKFAKYYTPAIVLMSAALAVIPASLRVHNQKQWYHIALVVLVSACPCALILSTPVAIFCALTKAAKSGVFFKGADYLETLANVKVMAFDKTGTVTRAEFEVTEFRSLLDDCSLSNMLYWVSSIESKSSHPMAAALVDLAQSHQVEPKPDKVEKFQDYPGEGIYGRIDGKEIYIGNSKISARAGCPSVPKLGGNIDEGKSVGYIFVGSTPAGIFSLADVCRTGAKEALKELKSAGIKTVMLTGDSYAAARHAQDQLGGALDAVHAELLPQDKAKIIEDYQKLAYTAMIGDGINDAPALATADIGISMGISGSALATETGHVILMTNDIRRIPKVARLARRVRRKILENMILSVATKGSIVALAIAGHPLVWAAVLADVGTCLLVILNSMLLLREKPKHQRKCCKSSAASALDNKQNKKCSGRDSLHILPCCSAIIPQEHCNVKSCCSRNSAPRHQSGPQSSSSSSCRSSKIADYTDKHSCCGNGKGIQMAKCSNLGSDNSDLEHIGELSTHQHGELSCSKSIKMLGKSLSPAKEDNGKSSESDLLHTHQPCCHAIKPQKQCEVDTCFSKNCAPTYQSGALSSSSRGSCKKSEFKNKKSCCERDKQARKPKCCNRGSCKGNPEHIGLSTHHHGESNCSESSKRHAFDDGVNEIEQCSSFNCKSCGSSVQDSQLSSKTEVEVKLCPDHPKDHITADEELGEPKRFCCGHDQGDNFQSLCKDHSADCSPPYQQTTTDILGGHNHVGCGAPRACLSKRHVGGCCESFRKECCVHGGHFEAGFRGGLSEIVIE